MQAFDLLHHPVFRKFNKVYISQQVMIATPITRVEKHHLKKMKPADQPIKNKQLLDVIKLKIKFEKELGFLDFLKEQFE